MAGRGPPPKPADQRVRRNKPQVSATFETDELPREEAPPLGDHPEGLPWHPRTLSWWVEVWSSPMREEILRADEDGLLALATLIDKFWKEPDAKLAAEIRLQRQCYGLTPLDRQRLKWEISRAEQAERARPVKPSPPRSPVADPRSVLQAI